MDAAQALSDLTEISSQIEAAVVLDADGSPLASTLDEQRTIAATTGPEPTVGLVFYDLKSCLRSVDEPKPKPRRSRKKAADGEA